MFLDFLKHSFAVQVWLVLFANQIDVSSFVNIIILISGYYKNSMILTETHVGRSWEFESDKGEYYYIIKTQGVCIGNQ